MNHFHAKAMFIDGCWRGFVRRVHRSGYEPVMDGAKAAAFGTKEQAEIAALRELERHMNSTITGYGERVHSARAAAERLFKTREGASA